MFVPEVVRNKALAAGAADWLDELPSLVTAIECDWNITVGRPFPDATEAFVAEAAAPEPAARCCSAVPCANWACR